MRKIVVTRLVPILLYTDIYFFSIELRRKEKIKRYREDFDTCMKLWTVDTNNDLKMY